MLVTETAIFFGKISAQSANNHEPFRGGQGPGPLDGPLKAKIVFHIAGKNDGHRQEHAKLYLSWKSDIFSRTRLLKGRLIDPG